MLLIRVNSRQFQPCSVWEPYQDYTYPRDNFIAYLVSKFSLKLILFRLSCFIPKAVCLAIGSMMGFPLFPLV